MTYPIAVQWPTNCPGVGQYSVTGSVVFDDGNTGICPECLTRQPLNLDGIVLAHGTES